MAKIAIMTDSNSSITQAEAKKLGITVLPMPLSHDERQELDGTTISLEDLTALIKSGQHWKTSQIPPLALEEAWDEALKTNDYIIYVPISQHLSTSYATCMSVQQLDRFKDKVFVSDSRSVAFFQGYEVIQAKKLADAGRSFDEIKSYLEGRYSQSLAYVVPENVDALKRGGRISAAAALMAGLLNITPIIIFKDGKLDKLGTARTGRKAYQTAVDHLMKDYKPEQHVLVVHHTQLSETFELIKSMITKVYPDAEVIDRHIPGVILCHTGFNTVAIGIAPR